MLRIIEEHTAVRRFSIRKSIIGACHLYEEDRCINLSRSAERAIGLRGQQHGGMTASDDDAHQRDSIILVIRRVDVHTNLVNERSFRGLVHGEQIRCRHTFGALHRP